MRIGVLLFSQTREDAPWLHTSKTKAGLLVSNGTHSWLSKCIIRELVASSTPQISPSRYLFSKNSFSKYAVPTIFQPLAEQSNLILSYPIKEESSYAEYYFKQTWGASVDNMTCKAPVYRRDSNRYKEVKLSSGDVKIKTMQWKEY